jgi:hypothetical protein
MGELMISFRGPPPKEFLERKVRQLCFESTNAEANSAFQALDLLGTYMTSSAVAPLNKEYIETESPLWYELRVTC